MKQKRNKHLIHIAAVLLSILTFIITIPESETDSGSGIRSGMYRAYLGSSMVSTYLEKAEHYPDKSEYRTALRLKKRLRKWRILSPSIHVLANAVKDRQALLKSKTTAQLQDMDGETLHEWQISLQKYPTWIEPHFSITKARFELSEKNIASYLEVNSIEGIATPKDVTIIGSTLSGSLLRTQTDGTATGGYDANFQDVASSVKDALAYNQAILHIPLEWREGTIAYQIGGEERTFTLLASGLSNFRGSTFARRANIKKGLYEHLHNVIVQPGEVFSFVETLDAPVTTKKGWKMAKVIFNTNELRMAPGGGICQISTTTYRAIVNAGLPVIERRSHSMYVTYYKKYGVGIDATIYPGTQDLAFLNDTGHPIIIQAYEKEGYDAVVNLYGVPDGRSVELKGPYFSLNAPEDFRTNGRQLWKNEIAWIQNIKFPDGTERQNTIVSRYDKNLPQSLAREYIIKEKDILAQRAKLKEI